MIKNSQEKKYRKRLKYLLTFRRDKDGRGVDQAYANYIAHNNLVKNSILYNNETGPVATVYHLKRINFNKTRCICLIISIFIIFECDNLCVIKA